MEVHPIIIILSLGTSPCPPSCVYTHGWTHLYTYVCVYNKTIKLTHP